MVKLRIFSDKNYVPRTGEYEPILYPFWGKPVVNPEEPFRGYYPHFIDFDPYIKSVDTVFELSSPEEADLLIIPNNWANWEEIQKPDPNIRTQKNQLSIDFFEKYQSFGKPFVSFFGSDFSHIYSLPVPSELNFRMCLQNRGRKKADFAIPCFCKDFLKVHLNSEILIREKGSKPVVGFDGYVPSPTLKNSAKQLAWRLERLILNPIDSRFNIGHLTRMKVIPPLLKSSLVETNFSIRENPFFNLHDVQKQKQLQSDYIQNMVNSDYIVCPRGSGPISARLYETLAFGRIPVFVNSDTVLPYDFAVDWKQYCVWIEEDEVPYIDRKIMEFHERLSPKDFIDLQHQCRELWVEWCSPGGFFKNLYRHLERI